MKTRIDAGIIEKQIKEFDQKSPTFEWGGDERYFNILSAFIICR